ncbi:hypothetical protein BJY01DRAFT_245025 [Aspergillus pseudoustus]|uniref:Uncharacterized protein n=1 Tax=Aspergillus pseudoustus TaxID=1810923 RepID=A0ABR4KGV5_9EURO
MSPTLLTKTTTTAVVAAAETAAALSAQPYSPYAYHHHTDIDIPTTEPACAITPQNSTLYALMASCCGSASVLFFQEDSSYSCLAQDQTVGELAACLSRGSEAGGGTEGKGEGQVQVWCNADDATASGSSSTAVGLGAATTQGKKTLGARGSETEAGTESEPEPEPEVGTTKEERGESAGTNGVDERTTISVVTALLLALVAFGGVVPPIP